MRSPAELLELHRRTAVRAVEDLTPESWSPPWVADSGGGGGAATAVFAKITGSIGATAPYRYSATQQEATGAGAWGNKAGGRTWNGTLRNIAEIGQGSGAAEVPDDAIVVAWLADGVAWVFDRLHYRGTFA